MTTKKLSLAQQAGVSLADVTAALVTLSAAGLTLPEAASAIRKALEDLTADHRD